MALIKRENKKWIVSFGKGKTSFFSLKAALLFIKATI